MKKYILIAAIILAFTATTFFGAAFAFEGDNTVYLGGTPLGIIVKADGLIVQDTCGVTTDKGEVYPARDGGIQPNDLIKTIDGEKIKEVQDINEIINKPKKKSHTVVVQRDNREVTLKVVSAMDKLYKQKKLGLIIKNDIAGVGTLTYVKKDLRFGGLGHQIVNDKDPNKDLYKKGCLYDCNIIGIIKGEKGKAGELRGMFNRNSTTIGAIDKTTFSGIFGFGSKELISGRPLIKLGTKEEVKNGKAYIYTTVNGKKPEKYEINITKVNKQNSPESKSMTIEITDERLINESSGIVQGMSGSPIVQNDKLIGAVTHVLISNPQKGYGIFVDWMINN